MIPQFLQRYRELLGRLDAHAARVQAAWPDAFARTAGCHGCRQAGLGVFAIEAANIEEWIGRNGLAPRRGQEEDPFPMQGGAGLCRIVPARTPQGRQVARSPGGSPVSA